MGYFYKSIDMFRFFYESLRPLDCNAMNIIILHLWDFYTSGMQDAEVNKVTAYFFCMDNEMYAMKVLDL